MKILFLGGPGTGKSTVGKRLAESLSWPWISSGAILRESKEEWVIEKLRTAELFDDEMVSSLVFSRLHGEQNAILDGFPRTLKQAEAIVDRGVKIDTIIELSVPEQEAVQRVLARGREQDTEEIVAQRWADYEKNKTEIVAFLIGSGVKLLVVDGVGDMDEVYKRVVQKIREQL